MLDFLNEKSAEGQWSSFNKWLIEHIQKGKLTNLLSFLFSDTEHIKTCYEPLAFIRNEAYQNALMACILSMETNQLNLLRTIDPSLYDERSSSKSGHRRSTSNPHMTFSPSTSLYRKSILANMKKSPRTSDYASEKVKVVERRKWNSLPNINHETSTNQRPRCHTSVLRNHSLKLQKKVWFKSAMGSTETPVPAEEVPYFEYRDSSAALKVAAARLKPPVPVHVVNVEEIKIHTDYRYSTEYQKSPTSSRPKIATKKLSLFSFLDQSSNASKITSNSIPNMSTSPTDIFFNVVAVAGSKIHSTSPIVKSLEDPARRKRSSRQNLSYFLQTINSSSRPKVALDRENAHFHLSEAIIATSQQLKWNKAHENKFKALSISQGKQFIPQRQLPPPAPISARSNPKFTVGSVDDDDDDESSSSNDEASTDKRTSSTSSDDVNGNVPQMEWNVCEDPHSAESIAMILMSKFKNQLLPSPSNLLWLVNESQAPQQLLPFPDSFSFPVNPDEPFHLNTFIRGSKDWAPPRQQIIFTVHPSPDRRRQCLKQSNRCAGCGMKVQVQYVHTFRYCDYLGKYFCSACHKNQISSIPARVLEKWDFSLFPVSNFAYKWLDEIWNLPLFHVADLNRQLYEKAKPLKRAREARLQLKYIQDFIEQCRFAEKEQGYCKEIPAHWTDDADIWSMTDFVDTKNNVFTERVQEIINRLEEHVIKNNCEVRTESTWKQQFLFTVFFQLCMARGFFCELCPNKRDIIFPWQNKISRCVHCGSCYHDKCFSSHCNKCERLKRRQRQLKTSATYAIS